ncbi:MAG: hypothetical protein QOG53_1099 [Frankiales bacterium]|jgi:hypothetical protein|nr:hypothetical protein [Frankiales bacterium]
MRVHDVILNMIDERGGTDLPRVLVHDGAEALMSSPIAAERVSVQPAKGATAVDGDIVLARVSDGDAKAIQSVLTGLPAGVVAAIALAGSLDTLPVGKLLDAVLGAGAQVQNLLPVQHSGLSAVLIAARSDSVLLPGSYLRGTGTGTGTDDNALRRIVAEWVVESAVTRAREANLERQLDQATRQLAAAKGKPTAAPSPAAASAAARRPSRAQQGLRHPLKAAAHVARKMRTG